MVDGLRGHNGGVVLVHVFNGYMIRTRSCTNIRDMVDRIARAQRTAQNRVFIQDAQ